MLKTNEKRNGAQKGNGLSKKKEVGGGRNRA